MATKRQIEASRRNGRLSNGPVSESGRERSKRNSARHGLSGNGTVLPEDMAETVNARYADWFHALKPYHEIDEFFTKQVATDSVMFEGAQKYLVVQINLQAKAAREDWDEDRYQQALD